MTYEQRFWWSALSGLAIERDNANGRLDNGARDRYGNNSRRYVENCGWGIAN